MGGMNAFTYGVRSRPYFGEVVCGDGSVILESDKGLFIAIIDSLGHGQSAAKLSREMELSINRENSFDLQWLLKKLDEEFRGSIGAAVTLFTLDRKKKKFECLNVGNNCVRVISHTSTSLNAQPGIVGERIPSLIPTSDNYEVGDMFVLTTDGIKEHFSLSDCPTLKYETAETATDIIMERFSKRHDDATVIVVRCDDE
ncbi:SpoIIE family protein phosphatase [Vibrio penaeicida]|uniref:SpoIIE family protein phosphatase n=1 Tax=Vibrio penaeicida TaxID=104609 RepID=UPI0027357DE6|nr:SpoIIE family protein phosphatase [Vibrio penaeicida]MDP2574678.1 SpoIIE family protein phosphatase [Vibrio penaeicida]